MEPNEERQRNDKKADRLAKRRERNDNVCSRRLLRKEKLAWESVEKHGKKRLAKGKQRLVFTTLCTNDTVAIQVEV
jgi:hypothetical protein